MARIRTIKPEFFTSEDIVGMTPLARLFYVALWCESDREGRLEWKPNTFKLRYLPGVDFGGVQYGVARIPKAFTARKTEPDGSTSVLIYGTSYDMSGSIVLSGKQEDTALTQLRGLLGRGAAYAPTLAAGYEQSLLFGILKSADVARDSVNLSSVRFEIEGLPT